MARKCRFCADKRDHVDYKDTQALKSFINDRGKILPVRVTKLCAFHQRQLARAVKRAREIALLPYEIQ